jgi:hypothetical protein
MKLGLLSILLVASLILASSTSGVVAHSLDHGQDVQQATLVQSRMSQASDLEPRAFLPLVQKPQPPPPPMTLYLHKRDAAPQHFLSAIRQDGTDFVTNVQGSQEWVMTLDGDLYGTEYAYSIYANSGPYRVTCDVEMLLRQGGKDTVLASWPRAFTVPTGYDVQHFSGTAVGIDPDAQEGDVLVLKIRPRNDSVLIFVGQFYDESAYSYVQVPGYVLAEDWQSEHPGLPVLRRDARLE